MASVYNGAAGKQFQPWKDDNCSNALDMSLSLDVRLLFFTNLISRVKLFTVGIVFILFHSCFFILMSLTL